MLKVIEQNRAGKYINLLALIGTLLTSSHASRTSSINADSRVLVASATPLHLSIFNDPTLLANSTNGPYCFSNVENGTPYRCAGTSVCTSNYQFCPFVDGSICPVEKPFRCFSDQSQCSANMAADCCPAGKFFCPHSRSCVNSSNDCCSLNPDTPVYC